MPIELTFNVRIRTAIDLILNDEVTPIIDLDGTRYLITVDNWDQGSIMWTPFDIATQTLAGDVSYSYPYAAHNILMHAVLGPSSRSHPRTPVTTEFPAFPVPADTGTVTP